MEITVITEEENPMLHRTDVRFRVSHAEATPDRLAVRDSLAARLNKSADEVVIRTLDTKFGMRETVGEAKVYQGADFAADVEQEHMLARNKIGEHGQAAEPEVEEDAGEAVEESEEAEEEVAEDADEAAEEPEADDETEAQADEDAEASDEEAEAEDEEASDDDADDDADEAEDAEASDEEAEDGDEGAEE